jgi:hypothetical protein
MSVNTKILVRSADCLGPANDRGLKNDNVIRIPDRRDECRIGSDHSRHRLQEHHVVVNPAFGHTVPGTNPGVPEHSRSLGEDLVGHDQDVIPFQDRKKQAPGKASAVGKSPDEDGRVQGDLHR